MASVAKDNVLIEGFSNLEFYEFKLVCKVISMLDSKETEEFKTIVLTKNELAEYLNVGKNYKRLINIVKAVPYKEVLLMKQRSFSTCYWFHVEVHDINIEFRFDPKLKPYLLKLRDNFTQYDLRAIQNFSCKYSFKLFELLLMPYNKQKKHKNEVIKVLEVDYLRKILFITNKYKNMPDFIRRVIKPSVEDINKYTNIYISYDKLVKGRITKGFNFSITENESNKNLFEVDVKDEEYISSEFTKIWSMYPLQKGLSSISHKQKVQICKIGVEEFRKYIDRYTKYVNERRKEFPAFNFMEGITFFKGRYTDYTDENYKKYEATVRKNNNGNPVQSTNFEQREYDDEFFDGLYDNF